MNEIEFIDRIDCNFPYHDQQEASWLIDLSCQLSSNAAFMVAHELARPPRSKLRTYRGKLSKHNQMVLLEMLNELEGKFEHPLKPLIFSICRKMIQGQQVTGDEALEALDYLHDFPGQYNAAAIAYMSCMEESLLEQIDQRCEALIQLWENRGV